MQFTLSKQYSPIRQAITANYRLDEKSAVDSLMKTLDLDILLYADHIIQSERLTVPHYDMHQREFVIIPLFEIAPHLVLPNGQSIQILAQKFADHHMVIVKHKNEFTSKIDRT